MNRLNYLGRLLKHIFTARHTLGFGVHSPYIFCFTRFVLYEKNPFYVYAEIERLRRELENDRRVLQVTDFGTGKNRQSSVASIARKSLNSSKYGQLLFRMVREAKPAVILELGTSLGISTAYMAMACTHAKCYTVEGCPQIASIASDNFLKFGLDNVRLRRMNIDEGLVPLLTEIERPDFVFIDANHTSDALLRYFEIIMSKVHNDMVIVIDDINWSDDMQEAWQQIKRHPNVINSLDIFGFGILFFNPERNKMHYKMIF
ncbi:MAG: class I SAM-dependent methyltransferase [Paludibacteraceae bacterium]|nr:class I SAM-dependent methyltransferase [Paludibacteraceae bacterium]